MTRGAVTLEPAGGRPDNAGNLTDAAFWDDYWGGFSFPDAIDENRSFDRALARRLRTLLKGAKGEVLEIGCAPGRWLAFFAGEFGLGVAGIELTPDGVAATRRNLEMLGVGHADIREADFLSATPSPTYDVVVSLGFVEHFTDVHAVIARHAAWLRPGGRLVIGVPNFRGVHGWLQKGLDPEILAHHNLEIMDFGRLTSVGPAAGLVTESVGYLGSLEPSLPISRAGVKGFPDFAAKVFLRGIRVLRRAPLIGRAMDHLNGSWVSSYILASYRKPQ